MDKSNKSEFKKGSVFINDLEIPIFEKGFL